MEKWEYLTVELQPMDSRPGKITNVRTWNPGYFTQQLNQYGAQGWELVSSFYVARDAYNVIQSSIFAMFKRQLLT